MFADGRDQQMEKLFGDDYYQADEEESQKPGGVLIL